MDQPGKALVSLILPVELFTRFYNMPEGPALMHVKIFCTFRGVIVDRQSNFHLILNSSHPNAAYMRQ